MPITGPSSYVPTTEQFEQHWQLADASLGAGNEIVFPDGTDSAALTVKKDALIAKRAEVQAKLNNKEIGRGDVEIKKAALLVRLVQFNDRVRAFFANTKWIGALPNAPQITEAQSKFTNPLDDVNNLWTQINADPATATPIVLVGGYTQAMCNTDLVAMKTSYATLNAAETFLKVTREERNDIQDQIYAILKTYRQVLPSFFAKGDALLESLPALSPLPGSTPNAVVASGSWNAATSQARITWSASTDPNLADYQVRFSPGPTYSTDDESVVATVQPGGTLEVFTNDGLATPGTTASFRVYVRVTTGNEKGSNTVVVTNPVGGGGPDPVTASGDWDQASADALITWDESADPNLDHYEIRMSPGSSYNSSSATTIGSVQSGTSEFHTTDGLANSGDVASFKVFVALTNGNEAGSNTVTITRP